QHAAVTDAELARDPTLRGTFMQLRDAPRLDLELSPNLVFDNAAVVEGREIVMQPAVVLPGIDEPLRFVFGVNLPELLRIAADAVDVATVIDRYHARVAPIDPRNL